MSTQKLGIFDSCFGENCEERDREQDMQTTRSGKNTHKSSIKTVVHTESRSLALTVRTGRVLHYASAPYSLGNEILSFSRSSLAEPKVRELAHSQPMARRRSHRGVGLVRTCVQELFFSACFFIIYFAFFSFPLRLTSEMLLLLLECT